MRETRRRPPATLHRRYPTPTKRLWSLSRRSPNVGTRTQENTTTSEQSIFQLQLASVTIKFDRVDPTESEASIQPDTAASRQKKQQQQQRIKKKPTKEKMNQFNTFFFCRPRFNLCSYETAAGPYQDARQFWLQHPNPQWPFGNWKPAADDRTKMERSKHRHDIHWKRPVRKRRRWWVRRPWRSRRGLVLRSRPLFLCRPFQ